LLQLVSGVGQAVELEVVLVVEEAARLEEELLEAAEDEVEVVLVVEEAARLEKELLEAAEDEVELVLAAAELEAEQDCESTFVDVTVTKTVDTETLEMIAVEAGKKTLLKTVMGVQTAALFVIVDAGRNTLLRRVMGVQTAALPVTVDAGSVTVEALTVMVVGIHDDSIEVVVGLNVARVLGDVLDVDVTSVVITGPVATQEQALEILLGMLEHWETISGRPVEYVLRVVV